MTEWANRTHDNQEGGVAIILAAVFGLFFICASVFGIWAFGERQSYKNDVDAKIEAATIIAVKEAETEKDKEFLEKEKLPTRNFTGSSTYGSVNFSYPKTWSIYSQEAGSGVVSDVYAHPGVLPGLNSEQPYALRMEVTSSSYDEEVSSYERAISSGAVSSTAFRPQKVTSVLGLKLTGEVQKGLQGTMVILPLRDRTIKIYTESQEFVNDFNNTVLPSLTFIP